MRLARQLAFILVVAATSAVCSTAPAVKPPELVRFVAPNYPDTGSTLPAEKVMAVVTVDANGTVQDVAIQDEAGTRSAGTRFDHAIIKAVHKWVFRPCLKGGKPVAVRISIPFSYELGEVIVDLGHYMDEYESAK